MNTRTNPVQQPHASTPPAQRRTFTAWLALGLFLLSVPLALAQDILMGLTSNGGPEGRGTAFSMTTAGANFSIVKGFADWGQSPQGDLVQGTDGNFYGMTQDGGTLGAGTIFRITPDGTITILRNFDNPTDGGYPRGGLIQGTDGNFYGMTNTGGPNNYGTIFKISPSGAYTVLKSMIPGTEGGNPQENLVQGKDGSFYGMNYSGGANGVGTIFRFNPSTNVYTVLFSFNTTTSGKNPYGSLVVGSDGILYGTTNGGGNYGLGTLFKFDPNTKVYAVMRHLQGADGGYLRGSLTFGNDGYLYGLGHQGGATGGGTIFRISTGGSFLVVRNLSGLDGTFPAGSLVKDSNGNFYGMMASGGTKSAGTIFRFNPATKAYTVLRSLDLTPDGGYPAGSLIRGTDGNFYGMTSSGGSSSRFGTLFKINANVSPAAFTVMARFNGSGSLGNAPNGSLVQANDGAFYGTNSAGGTYGYGTLFKICGGVTTVIKSFNRPTDGATPKGSLIQATDGNLYGLASDGGTNGYGTIFKFNPTTNVFAVIRHLAVADGTNPVGSLTQGTDGHLYGLGQRGGSKGAGTIFRINPATNVYSVLRHLDYAADGANPEGNLVQANDGKFYGMFPSNGRIFSIMADGTFAIVHTLSYYTQGGSPSGSLIKGSATDPYLYGMATYGGSGSVGTVFKINPATKAVSVLRHLTLTTDGGYPKGNLVRGADGTLYGMTQRGGANKVGTIFKIVGSTFSVVRHLKLASDGGNPMGSLILRKPTTLVANAQAVTTTEDVAKAITLTGAGGSPLTYNIVSGPKYGKLSGTGSARTYTPFANYSGSDSFTFVVTMGCVSSAPATVTITVSGVNDAPVLAAIGSKSIAKGQALTFTALATDPDAGQTKTFSLVSPPAGATIGATTGAFSWTPTATGTFSVTVKVTDNGSPVLSDTETITVTVTATLAARIGSADDFEEAVLTNARLFPNPVVGSLTVQFDGGAQQVQSTVITDATGKAHLTDAHRVQSDNELGIDVSGLKEGLYLLRLQTPQGAHTLRFIKK
jgi:uncharacterized repeat protein (TIGR03803 family)